MYISQDDWQAHFIPQYSSVMSVICVPLHYLTLSDDLMVYYNKHYSPWIYKGNYSVLNKLYITFPAVEEETLYMR